MESELSISHKLSEPLSTIVVTTRPSNDTVVPFLIDDTASSGMPSEGSHDSGSSYPGSTSCGRSQSDNDVDSSDIVDDRGRSARYYAGRSGRRTERSASVSSGDYGRYYRQNRKTSRSRLASSRRVSDDNVRSCRTNSHVVDKGRSESSPLTEVRGRSAVKNTATRRRSVGRRGDRWTRSEDAILKGMKEGGETWTSIATTLGRGRKVVQQRYKTITTSREHDSDDVESGRDKGYKKRSRAQKRPMPCRSLSYESSSSSVETDSVDSEEEQQLYLQEQIRNHLYPPYLSIEADDHFTRRDCEVLATIDSKMKRGRWLEMQANFFNATGRMVPISVFRDKCEAAELDRIREAKIKSWTAGLDESEQIDPYELE
jgi:hypothetical protein